MNHRNGSTQLRRFAICKVLSLAMAGVFLFTSTVYSFEINPDKTIPIHASINSTVAPNELGYLQYGWRTNYNRPKSVYAPIRLPPVAGDIIPDNAGLEVFFGGYNQASGKSQLFLWNYLGNSISGWPKEVSGLFMSYPAFGNVDVSSENLEIAVPVSADDPSEQGKLDIYTAAGGTFSEWSIDEQYIGAPVMQDINEDGTPEIFALGSNEGGSSPVLYGWSANGSVLSGFPVSLAASLSSRIICVSDMDNDGNYEIVCADNNSVYVLKEDGTDYSPNWPVSLPEAVWIGAPVVGDVNLDGEEEALVPVRLSNGLSYLYCITISGSILLSIYLENFQFGLDDGNEDYISLGDIDNNQDNKIEIVCSSTNGYLGVWYADGRWFPGWPVYVAGTSLYKTAVANIDNDYNPGNDDVEIIATSSTGMLYIWNHDGSLWPPYSGGTQPLSKGCVIADIDGYGTDYNKDIELLFGAENGSVYAMGTGGYFVAEGMFTMMPRFGFDNCGEFVPDYNTNGWSIFADTPAKRAEISVIYDWYLGKRAIRFEGAGRSSGYMYSGYWPNLDLAKTVFRWFQKFPYEYEIYIRLLTKTGIKWMHYNSEDSDREEYTDDEGKEYIHHGLGSRSLSSDWVFVERNLLTDLQHAEQFNDIVKVVALYIRGDGQIYNMRFLPPDATGQLPNMAEYAGVRASSERLGEGYSCINVIDGKGDTIWMINHDTDPFYTYPYPYPWVELYWDSPLEKVNKIILRGIPNPNIRIIRGILEFKDANGRVVYTHPVGELPNDGSPLEIILPSTLINILEIKFTILEYWIGDLLLTPGIAEFGVYYDPSLEPDYPPQEGYTTDTYIRIENGYFWNPVLNGGDGNIWIPHGIAYQTWVSDLGVWQERDAIESALCSMQSMGVNSLRVDFVWKHIETANNQFNFENYDFLLSEAKKRGMKVFPLIGYQWPPNWGQIEYPDTWYTMHPPENDTQPGYFTSDIMIYESSDVQDEFEEFIQTVVTRYHIGGAKEDLADTVAGWILGNEYGYIGLWSGRYCGYDETSKQNFRGWLARKYNDIEELNVKWRKDNEELPGYLPNYRDLNGDGVEDGYLSFYEVDMPTPYGVSKDVNNWAFSGRDKASWYDLTQWREESIANFVATAADAVRETDLNHLITYAAVGMQWGETDWRYHTEDAHKIVEACQNNGAGLDFWSINNYPWAMENNELMTGQWGIERAKHDTGLPVMYTETGFTTTEQMYPFPEPYNDEGTDPPGPEDAQARLLRNAVWEALENGVIGVHAFTWQERNPDYITPREVGFGIVRQSDESREIKLKEAYYKLSQTYYSIENIITTLYDPGSGKDISVRLPELFRGSTDPDSDVVFLWDDAVDTIINRYEAEMEQLFGTLERLGYEPGFINREELMNQDYLNYKAVILPRNQKMFGDTFSELPMLVDSGIKLFANVDLPGIMDEYGYPWWDTEGEIPPDWPNLIIQLFGIDPTEAEIDTNLEDGVYRDGLYEAPSGGWLVEWLPRFITSPLLTFTSTVLMWKYRDDKMHLSPGGTILANFEDFADDKPALVINNDHSAAISLFSLGDNKGIDTDYPWSWEDRYNWLYMLFKNPDVGFGIEPELDVISTSGLVIAECREGPYGTFIISFRNYNPRDTETVVVRNDLFKGKTIKSVITNKIEENSDGEIVLDLEPFGHDLLLAYEPTPAQEEEPQEEEPQEEEPQQEEPGGGQEEEGGGGGDGGGDGGVKSYTPSAKIGTSLAATQTPSVTTTTSPEETGGFWGPATIVILDESGKRKKEEEEEEGNRKGKEKDVTSERGNHIRTYVGSEYRRGGSGEPVSSPPLPPPMGSADFGSGGKISQGTGLIMTPADKKVVPPIHRIERIQEKRISEEEFKYYRFIMGLFNKIMNTTSRFVKYLIVRNNVNLKRVVAKVSVPGSEGKRS